MGGWTTPPERFSWWLKGSLERPLMTSSCSFGTALFGWLGIPAYGRRRVLERPVGLGKGYRGAAQKDGGDDTGRQARSFVSTHVVAPRVNAHELALSSNRAATERVPAFRLPARSWWPENAATHGASEA